MNRKCTDDGDDVCAHCGKKDCWTIFGHGPIRLKGDCYFQNSQITSYKKRSNVHCGKKVEVIAVRTPVKTLPLTKTLSFAALLFLLCLRALLISPHI